jgi:hypothetical protein
MTDPIQKQMLCVQIWMLIVQVLGILGLAFYAFETRRIRKASENQVQISQGLIKAAMDQVEGLSKPCLTLHSALRGAADAIAEIHGATGNTIAAAVDGSFAMQNIGNGTALNVRYQFLRVPREEPAGRHHPCYLQNILAGQKVSMPQPITGYGGDWELQIEYQSIGGREYRSVLLLNERVLTKFDFSEARRAIGV